MDFVAEILNAKITWPNKPAIVFHHQIYSYAEFISASEKLAKIFSLLHVKNHVCAVFSEKTISLFEAMLACFISKTIYMPLNILAAPARNKKLLQMVDPDFIYIGNCTRDTAISLLDAVQNKIVLISDEKLCYALESASENNKLICIDTFLQSNTHTHTKNNIAYLFFTSGSTGDPKGVPISFSNINAYLHSARDYFQFESNDRVSQISDVAFDLFIHETLLSFIVGATLFVYDDRIYFNLAHFIDKNQITHCILVPSTIPVLVKQCHHFSRKLFSLRKTIGCGEAFPIEYAKMLTEITPHSRIFNAYGPTETTVACVAHEYHSENNYGELFILPIGKPLSSVCLNVSDTGELIISGDQVAAGYWKVSPISQSFYRDPILKNSYKTGDIVCDDSRWGYLFCGRRDDQWQIKGYRVEKTEIECALRVVFCLPDIYIAPHRNQHALIDCVIAFSTAPLDLCSQKPLLLKWLPAVAIPERVICLPTIPRLPNGKIHYSVLSNLVNDVTLSYYAKQSVFSDPGDYMTALFDFSSDVTLLSQQVNTLLLHYADAKLFSYEINPARYSELNVRYTDSLLRTIIEKNNRPLLEERKIEERALGVCRDSALLCCAILRSRGIPARLRSGFVSYFMPGFYLDGFCLEYFDVLHNRWKLADIRTTPMLIDHYNMNIDFDLTDMPLDRFVTAPTAWQWCRTQKKNPNHFGSRFHRGFYYVRNRLIQDLALCCKKELLIWDLWGAMLHPESDDLDLLDELAELLLNDSFDIKKIEAFYNANSTLQVPDTVLTDNPFLKEEWTVLRRG